MRKLVIGFAAGCLLAAASGGVWAAAPAPTIGVVDMDRISREYKAMQELNRQFQDFQKQQEAQLERRKRIGMLNDQEEREYLDTVEMGAPTDARDRRIAELERLSDERSRRRLALREKKDLTPEEEAERAQLEEIYNKRMDELVALQSDLQKTVYAKYDELSKIVTDSVDAAVKQVAQEKGLALILRKEIVLFGGLDITEDVLAKLNAPAAK
jgi:Skp family chaperone for outer membrane proteins